MTVPPAVTTSDARWWVAPAKLNLMLRIVGQRADGYHLLQTVFQFLDWGDELQLLPRDDGRIELLNPIAGVPADEDLCVRAAQLLREAGGAEHDSEALGVSIRLRKRIPLGGGLGGGSSDAATVLVVLNRLWQLGLSNARLQQLGLSLGADVPVFVRGCAAWAEGVGEQLQCIEPPQPWYVVLQPSVRVATAVVFGDENLTRDAIPVTMADFLRGSYGNDCEPVVRRRYPEIDRALDWLSTHADGRLTGTGACVFAAFTTREQAEKVAAQVPDEWQVEVARGANRSALHRQLED